MKKLLNKLFERLGYVPKEEYEITLSGYKLYKGYRHLKDSIKADEVRYKIGEKSKHFDVFMTNGDAAYPIKVFYWKDDRNYAKLCAEELCEKLNEKI